MTELIVALVLTVGFALAAVSYVVELHAKTVRENADRHERQVSALQQDIRNLTESLARSEGKIFLPGPRETKPTEQWFTAKPVVFVNPD